MIALPNWLKIGVWALVLAAVTAGGAWAYAQHLREVDALRKERDELASMATNLRAQIDSAEEKFRVDTVALTKLVTRWRETVDTITVLQHQVDTVTQTATGGLIALADTTIKACTYALGDCARLRSMWEDRATIAERRNVELERRLKKPLARSVGEKAIWLLVGVGIGSLAR